MTDYIKTWKKTLNKGVHFYNFERRLAAEGLTEEDAAAICRKADEEAGCRAGARRIREICQKTAAARKNKIYGTDEERAEEILGALVSCGMEQLQKDMGGEAKELLSPAAWEDLSGMLAKRLSLISGRVMRYTRYSVGELVEYPVLMDMISGCIDGFSRFIGEFAQRFAGDRNRIARELTGGGIPRKIEGLTGEISDLHAGGKCVLIAEVSLVGGSRKKLVYKPRSLEIDRAWEIFVSSLTEAGFAIDVPHAADMGTYGYVEFVEHTPCKTEEEVRSYFRNAGGIMALLYAFDGNDFHYENLIASGSSPVIIDVETLMIPTVRPFAEGKTKPSSEEKKEGSRQENAAERKSPEKQSIFEVFGDSVSKQGFLPFRFMTGGGKLQDGGALTGSDGKSQNLPLLDGKEQKAFRYREHVAQGFEDMYRYLMGRKAEMVSGGGLDAFKGAVSGC